MVDNSQSQKVNKLLGGMGGLKVSEEAKEDHHHHHDVHDHHDHDHDHDHDHHHYHEENINIRAAVVHVIGDMLQSIGVIIASVLIYFYPEAKIADPICTYIFSILVIITTVPVFKSCMQVLMEQ